VATNQFGLSRDIPTDVQRAVRQHCGFGCVLCANAIYVYHHFDPPFERAREHRPDGITLLCGACHDRATRGILSEESVRFAAEHPKSRQDGFSFGPFDIGTEHPSVVLGSFRAVRTRTVVRAFGTPVLEVEPPEATGTPFLLSAELRDRNGSVVLKIVRNEWRTPIQNWDAEVVGQRITVRRALGDIVLRLRTEPPKTLVVERMDMSHYGSRLQCSEGGVFTVSSPDGSLFSVGVPAVVEDCEVGLDVVNQGISVGCNCSSMRIGQF